MKTVYIAGPFRASSAWLIEQNIRKAEEYALDIAVMGAAPLCPHTMYRFFQGALPDRFWLEVTMELAKKCDAIFMCNGWEQSSGSRGERHEMIALGRPVFESFAMLDEWLREEDVDQ
jgi:hypothetical protein